MRLINSALAAAAISACFIFSILAPSAHATSIFHLTDSSNLTVRIVVTASDGITSVTAINEDVAYGGYR